MTLEPAGGLALSRDQREIEEAIHLILGTAYGERPMRPDFGCGIHDYVFAEADGGTAGLIAHEVRTSLRRWEPRIDVVDIVVTIDDVHRNRLWIDVFYSLRGTNDVRNLVFPFYVIPEEQA
jgi:phage baseplate assembly protein W